ncbi:relaxase/mobilization nuclease domain-containing protein (plasmid) [Phocaeicola vulgatus]|nr:relaxase/mobilization nuclease domain-containing protein [Phocaeicola vulgatus]
MAGAALEYDLAKEINGEAVATEIARHELFGCTGAEMVQEMKPYHIDFPNVKNNCLRFEVSPSVEESAAITDADWAELGNDFMQRMGLANHQYIIIRHSGTESKGRASPPAHTGKPGFLFGGTVPGQLDREKGQRKPPMP